MEINANPAITINVNRAAQQTQNTQTVIRENLAHNREIQDKLELNTDQIAQRTQFYRANLETITKDPLYLDRKSTSFFGRKGPIP
ncbi:MAG: hypothetical protein KBA26_00135 [Candidatus Delongbacteria bacterium]|nr:hypothetical protein [Candidatus Delongbacteria bacterium]